MNLLSTAIICVTVLGSYEPDREKRKTKRDRLCHCVRVKLKQQTTERQKKKKSVQACAGNDGCVRTCRAAAVI